MSERLPRDFYAQDTIEVARQLIGQVLVHHLPDGTRLAGRIVETEAYLGIEDPACHSFGGRRTPRTSVMYEEPGTSYIYFIYGMYYCFNAVTMPKGVPEAVLIRAIEPLEGVEHIARRRGLDLPPHKLGNGPGKVCLAMTLGREHNALDLTTHLSLGIEKGINVPDDQIDVGPRIGIGDRHDAVHWPLRFGWKNHPALSPPRFPQDEHP